MVNSDYIIHLKASFQSLHPPLEAGLPMILPVVKRIPPKLSRRGKRVGRTARHRSRITAFIKLEQLRIRPCIGAVKRHIDRNIADELYLPVIRIAFQLFPLNAEQILLELIELDLLRKLLAVFRKCLGFTSLNIFIPFYPADIVEGYLDCHIQRIVIEPVGIVLDKHAERRFLRNLAVLPCLAQELEAALIDLSIIYILCIVTEVIAVALLLCQIAALYEIIGINEIGISRKGRKGLVGRVSVARRPQRENLPVTLSRLRQSVNKIVCRL